MSTNFIINDQQVLSESKNEKKQFGGFSSKYLGSMLMFEPFHHVSAYQALYSVVTDSVIVFF